MNKQLTIELVELRFLGADSVFGYTAHYEDADLYVRVSDSWASFLELYPTMEALLWNVLAQPELENLVMQFDVVEGVPRSLHPYNIDSGELVFPNAHLLYGKRKAA
jgi:hypothetical protein